MGEGARLCACADVLQHTQPHRSGLSFFFFPAIISTDTDVENMEILILDLDSGFQSAFAFFVCLFRDICACLFIFKSIAFTGKKKPLASFSHHDVCREDLWLHFFTSNCTEKKNKNIGLKCSLFLAESRQKDNLFVER